MTASALALYCADAVRLDMTSAAAGADTSLGSSAGYAMAAQNMRRSPHRCIGTPVGRRTRLTMPLVVRRDVRLWHELGLIRGREVPGC